MTGHVAEPHIGTLNEKPLHAALKQWISEPGDRFEVRVGRHVADIVRGSAVIEVQTGSTFPLKRKLSVLLREYPVHLVLPITQVKTIVALDEAGEVASSRRSPRKGAIHDIFDELVNLRDFLGDANFSIEALLVHIEEVRQPRTTRRRRWRDWEVKERRLVEVFDQIGFQHPGDFLAAIPSDLEEPFTTADLAQAIARPRRVAQRIAYTLREMGAIALVNKTRAGYHYIRNFGAST